MRIVNRIKELLFSAISHLLYFVLLLLLMHHAPDTDGRQQGYQHHQYSVSPLLATFHFACKGTKNSGNMQAISEFLQNDLTKERSLLPNSHGDFSTYADEPYSEKPK
jgi:hypothetical protein